MSEESTPDGYATFHGNGGWDHEKKSAMAILELGKTYKVTGGQQHTAVTYIELEGIHGSWNTALFDCNYDSLPITPWNKFYFTRKSE